MKNDISTLNVFLNDYQIGSLVNLPGDTNLFTFNQEYIDDPDRPTLSLSFKDKLGELITNIKMTRTRLSPFFSNLLPEGEMRTYLALRANVNEEREFFLLSVLGYDLPGAITLYPEGEINRIKKETFGKNSKLKNVEGPLRFSLAGVQLKFSAIKNNLKGLTIPVNGVGGSWIVKLPSAHYKEVPENEFTMMELARKIGIAVPETMLVPLKEIEGLPKEIKDLDNNAYAIKRFDRSTDGKKIHMEDFAQVFGVYPHEKYKKASYRNIAQVISAEIGVEGIVEFTRRFVFNVLIGNGDMHLKNWSLLYLDQKKAVLAPAYDFVSTLPYIPNETLALKFAGSNKFHSLTWDQFKRFAAKAQLPEKLVLNVAQETIQKFVEAWKEVNDLHLNPEFKSLILEHLKTLPILGIVKK